MGSVSAGSTHDAAWFSVVTPRDTLGGALRAVAAVLNAPQLSVDDWRAVREQAGIGSSLEADHARRLAVAGLTVDAVRAAADEQTSLEPSLIVVVGDPEAVLPQLAALGLDPVEVDPETLEAKPAAP